MLDHVFTDAIGALRDALEKALLERQAFEERFQMDLLLGDITWETTYGLPGEGTPPRVRADVTLSWPTWSQTAYRTWYLDEEFVEPPQVEIEIAMRIQRLVAPPQPEEVLVALPAESPLLGTEHLRRGGPTVESIYGSDLAGPTEHTFEVTYEGVYDLDESTLADGSVLDELFGSIGGWVAATLVRLGDLSLDFLPASDGGT